MKWKRVLVTFSIALLTVSMSLLVVPALAQYTMGPEAVFAAESENNVKVETKDRSWLRTAENTVNFVLDAAHRGRNYEVYVTYEFNITDPVDRITIVIWKIYSNGIYVDQLRHDFVNVSWCSGGGDNGPVSIPSKTLKTGENTVKLLMTFNSTASEIPVTLGMFKFTVKTINVREIRVDTDGDGLYNNVDPVANLNNFQLSATLLIALFPLITATGIERRKK